MKPIAITMGDSSGVGPEILLKAFKNRELPHSLFAVGDFSILRKCNELLQLNVSLHRVAHLNEFEPESLNVIDLSLLRENDLRIGEISKASGFAALKYVEHATKMAVQKQVSAIVTLPINKEATRLSTPGFCGHTEFITELCGEEDSCMMLVSKQLIVTHVSTHVSMREAISRTKKDRILRVIQLTNEALEKLRPQRRIAVAGLNPHASESGAFGAEEAHEISPAVEEAQRQGIDAKGPFPPDTLFMQAVKGRYDAVVCMYHDQGHIPLKLLDFEGGINVTLGLPIVRTSVDHGTAFDIAYQGKAFTRSLHEASELAVKLAG